MARLAAVDAVMEQVLGAHEHRLLSTVPALLEKHFERLRQAEPEADASRGGWTCSARTCKACCSPNWIFDFNRSKGCSKPFA